MSLMLSLSAFRQDAGNLKLLHREIMSQGLYYIRKKNQVLDNVISTLLFVLTTFGRHRSKCTGKHHNAMSNSGSYFTEYPNINSKLN